MTNDSPHGRQVQFRLRRRQRLKVVERQTRFGAGYFFVNIIPFLFPGMLALIRRKIFKNFFSMVSVEKKLPRGEDLRVKLEHRSTVNPIQVDASTVSSVMSVYDAVGIEHRDQLEHVLFTQCHRSWIRLAEQKAEKAVHDKTGLRLAGMNSRAHEDGLLGRRKFKRPQNLSALVSDRAVFGEKLLKLVLSLRQDSI